MYKLHCANGAFDLHTCLQLGIEL